MTLAQPASDYGQKVLAIEPYGTEPVPGAERHGATTSQFTLWLGSNLTIADFALGFLAISLHLPWLWALAAMIVGNVLGALLVGACAAMGPSYGVPQMVISRNLFGHRGGYLPGLLNYVSTIGWFSVNNILGSFGLQILIPGLAFWQAALVLVVIQGLLAVYGHNLIHRYEAVMSVVLAVLFLIVSAVLLGHHTALSAYQPAAGSPWTAFLIMLAAAFSYTGSWAPYASDYSRYLPASTAPGAVLKPAFLGSFFAPLWLELVGAGVAVLAGPGAGDPISSLHSVMGGLGGLAVVAIILGGTAADALNLYSNAMSAAVLDVHLPRWTLAAGAGLIGLALSLAGSGHFESFYENFLLMLGYWITPWAGVMITDFYLRGRRSLDGRSTQGAWWPGILSFLVGFAVAVPFMAGPLFTGPVARQLGGIDLSFYVGFLVAMLVYWFATSSRDRSSKERV